MSYTPNSPTSNISPFDVGKITGTTDPKFNTLNVNWLSMSGNNIVANNSISYYSEACFSPDNNQYGLVRVAYDGNTSNYHLMGLQYPESSNPGAGGATRGDDVAIHFGNTHYPYFNYQGSSIANAQDVNRANIKIIRIEI